MYAKLRAFIVYVKPLLEYALCVWLVATPHQPDSKLESVQRKFTKRLAGLGSVDYRGRLLRLELYIIFISNTKVQHRYRKRKRRNNGRTQTQIMIITKEKD